MATILVTGTAGFIGFHLAKELLKDPKNRVIGIDNMNDYYSPLIKEKRNNILKENRGYHFIKADIADFEEIMPELKGEKIDQIVHLAAQAGVRYSIENPKVYAKSNIVGTLNIFEFARGAGIKKVVFASSSSVYGNSTKVPFSESDPVDRPISLYAATKKSTELMAYTYSHLYGINMIGLRFFTVYGEFTRPDMATFKFAKSIISGKEIEVFNYGNMERDFTFVSDIVDGILSAMGKDYRYEIFNLGNSKPVKLGYFIELLEKNLCVDAKKKMLPLQAGDVLTTYADLSKSEKMLGYKPKVPIEEGLKRFCVWFRENQEWLLELK
jgi:UDP-glucuronate 4-epimerase